MYVHKLHAQIRINSPATVLSCLTSERTCGRVLDDYNATKTSTLLSQSLFNFLCIEYRE